MAPIKPASLQTPAASVVASRAKWSTLDDKKLAEAMIYFGTTLFQ